MSLDQCEENTMFCNHALYLGLPCCKEDSTSSVSPSGLPFQRSSKETLWISTQLSSTKLTQNGLSACLRVCVSYYVSVCL